MKHSPEQYLLDFNSRINERCAKIAGLRNVQLGIGPGRINGVVELLQRLTVYAQFLPEELRERYSVKAQVMAIAARIHQRHSVSEKTVRNWTKTAVELGCLRVDYVSQQFGGNSWNVYHVDFDRVMSLLSAGNGRKRPETISDPGAETISDPGAETISDPGAETISDPLHVKYTSNTHTPLKTVDTRPSDTRFPSQGAEERVLERNASKPKTVDTQPSDTRFPSQGAVVAVFLKLGVGRASTLVAEAIQRGCDTRRLLALARWFERSQRSNPTRWEKPSTVLMLRLAVADPDVPAWLGWIPGRPRRPEQKRDTKRLEEFQRVRDQNRKSAEMSMSEMFASALAKKSEIGAVK